MTAKIQAKFEKNAISIIFKGYDITVNGQVIAHYYSEYECIIHIMDDNGLKLV